MNREPLQARRTEVLAAALEHVAAHDPLIVLKAPPGSGHSWLHSADHC